MGLESGTFINDLDTANPVGSTDSRSQADDHLRLIKSVAKNTFPNASRAFRFPRSQTKSGPYTILSSDQNNSPLVGDASGGAISLTLPTLASGDDGWSIVIVKGDASANAVTVVGTINGGANYSIIRRYDAVMFMWTGSLWFAAPFRLVVGTEAIEDNAITLAKMADNSVGTSELIALAVTAAKLASDSVTTAKILDGNATNPKLAAPRMTMQALLSGTGATYTTPANCHTIIAFVMGGAGGGGATITNNGANGTASTFDGVNANGGLGGNAGGNNGAGGAGGSGGTGTADFRMSGSDGSTGNGAVDAFNGGSGAPGLFGMGSGRGGANAAGQNGKANTGGGGGGAGAGAAPDNNGGGGGSGELAIVIRQSPAATYSFTIGPGGNGGAAGTAAGGNGGSGVILVLELY